jgi:hypothetical protein
VVVVVLVVVVVKKRRGMSDMPVIESPLLLGSIWPAPCGMWRAAQASPRRAHITTPTLASARPTLGRPIAARSKQQTHCGSRPVRLSSWATPAPLLLALG